MEICGFLKLREMLVSEPSKARDAFIKIIKQENFELGPDGAYSLRAHWRGSSRGFHDHMLQSRYQDFLRGWNAATSSPAHSEK
jgi:hypothetical protein